MHQKLKLNRLPKLRGRQGPTFVNFRRTIPGSIAELVVPFGGFPRDAALDPSHPAALLSRPRQQSLLPQHRHKALHIRAVPNALLQRPDPCFPDPPYGSMSRTGTVDMSLGFLIAKKSTHKSAVVRKTLARRVKSAIGLVMTRGADVRAVRRKDGSMRKELVYSDDPLNANKFQILQGWTYIARPELEILRMPLEELIPLIRAALSRLWTDARRLEAEWNYVPDSRIERPRSPEPRKGPKLPFTHVAYAREYVLPPRPLSDAPPPVDSAELTQRQTASPKETEQLPELQRRDHPSPVQRRAVREDESDISPGPPVGAPRASRVAASVASDSRANQVSISVGLARRQREQGLTSLSEGPARLKQAFIIEALDVEPSRPPEKPPPRPTSMPSPSSTSTRTTPPMLPPKPRSPTLTPSRSPASSALSHLQSPERPGPQACQQGVRPAPPDNTRNPAQATQSSSRSGSLAPQAVEVLSERVRGENDTVPLEALEAHGSRQPSQEGAVKSSSPAVDPRNIDPTMLDMLNTLVDGNTTAGEAQKRDDLLMLEGMDPTAASILDELEAELADVDFDEHGEPVREVKVPLYRSKPVILSADKEGDKS